MRVVHFEGEEITTAVMARLDRSSEVWHATREMLRAADPDELTLTLFTAQVVRATVEVLSMIAPGSVELHEKEATA